MVSYAKHKTYPNFLQTYTKIHPESILLYICSQFLQSFPKHVSAVPSRQTRIYPPFPKREKSKHPRRARPEISY